MVVDNKVIKKAVFMYLQYVSLGTCWSFALSLKQYYGSWHDNNVVYMFMHILCQVN